MNLVRNQKVISVHRRVQDGAFTSYIFDQIGPSENSVQDRPNLTKNKTNCEQDDQTWW